MANILIDHVDYYRSIQIGLDIPLELIFNMDQTAVDLSDLFNKTLERKGVKSVKIVIPKNLPSRVTVLLTIGFGGQYLPPLVVSNAKPGGRVSKEFQKDSFDYPKDLEYTVQANAWTDQVVMDLWLENVFQKQLEKIREENPLANDRMGNLFN